MLTDPFFYAVAIPAVILVGLAKGGFAGIGVVATPLLALAVGPVKAAAILLPLLIVQDVVGVWAYRKTWDKGLLILMVPPSAVGIFLGWALAALVSSSAVELAVGVVSVLFAVQRLWAERAVKAAAAVEAGPARPWLGALCGMASGFISQIAHAGGPPFQIYVLPRRLPRDVFVGTSAIFFAIVNWMKMPAYLALGQFTSDVLTAVAVLIPLAFASTWAGVWLVRRVPAEGFYKIIYVLLIVVGTKLAWDGFFGLM
ncbi:sulfite exporter TauE/SafE family protein [Caulobacter hibisci]|uniref:Probable membrane transporter protein n=1 Tax=Caulobacter hibisci TaxID=2035993 RepID=A0ABS0SYN9_9CAUL|nr:sulfite exporter TauE/SafE family protein [Caulobacter hibisci]MBI1684740.1 sulfite exporter TauE/SafE family protein [Caulobacter hibisci]